MAREAGRNVLSVDEYSTRATFYSAFVRDRWQYPLGPAALRRHSEGCRGLALPP